MRIRRIEREGLDAMEKSRERVCGCGRGDAVCGGGYVCSSFVACVMLCENSNIGEGKEWTIIYATMQEEASCRGRMARYLYISLLYWVGLVWVIIMSPH